MNDSRHPPICFQEIEALDAIRARDRRGRGDLGLTYAVAVYGAMTEVAEYPPTRGGFKAARKAIAEKAGVSAKTVDRVFTELEEDALLLTTRDGDGEIETWRLVSLGDPEVQAARERAVSARAAEQKEPRPNPKSVEAKKRQYAEVLAEANIEVEGSEDEVILDGLDLLSHGEKVDKKVVTPEEMATAAAALSAFNQNFHWKRPGGVTVHGSDYGLGANLASIVMRVRERRRWDIPTHVRLVESAWRIRWWEREPKRRPGPNVIWGGKSFENVVQDASDEAKGESPAAIQRRYTRSPR